MGYPTEIAQLFRSMEEIGPAGGLRKGVKSPFDL